MLLTTDYPKDPRKLKGVSTRTHFVQIALTPKRAGLVWTFINTIIVKVRSSVSKKKSTEVQLV